MLSLCFPLNSETDIPVEDGADGDAQAKEPSESVSDAANTTTGSKEDDKDSPPKGQTFPHSLLLLC